MNDPVIPQIAVLLVFALVLLLINLKAGMNFLKFITFWAMVACLVGSGYLVVRWMFL